jgi:predicted MPP superfamily phosphohydrolase
MRFAWTTDLHLCHAASNPIFLGKFYDELSKADGIFITGDIAEAPSLSYYLDRLEEKVQKPVYFVLGNHDFYRGSIQEVRAAVAAHCEPTRFLCYLHPEGVVDLNGTALIGVDGWADTRAGDYKNSGVDIADYYYISELINKSHAKRGVAMRTLADESAKIVREKLLDAVKNFKKIILLIHQPPYAEACWHEGHLSDSDWQPHFTCVSVGRVLSGVMKKHPDCQLTVYCGHSHGGGYVRVLPNLEVFTGKAVYGFPEVQKIVEI